jgi:hypothetical protein
MTIATAANKASKMAVRTTVHNMSRLRCQSVFATGGPDRCKLAKTDRCESRGEWSVAKVVSVSISRAWLDVPVRPSKRILGIYLDSKENQWGCHEMI